MPTEKRDRYLRRAARRAAGTSGKPRREPDDRQVALRAAAEEKSARLAELRSTYQPRIAELELEYAEKRREVWADYEYRKGLIRSATILDAKA